MALTELALTVARAKRGGGDASLAADRAMGQLAPHITRAARLIHGRHASLRRQRAVDFVSSAPALVWNKIENFEGWYYLKLPPDVRSDPTKDWFIAWVRTELGYRYLDAGRGQGGELRPATLDEHVAAAPEATEEDVGEFRLAPADVQRLRRWDPLDAVILFTLGNQWDQVPAGLRGEWLADLGLTPPFPTDAFRTAPHSKRRTVLAADLGISRDVIYQRWLRLKKRFNA